MARFEHNGQASRFFQKDGRYFGETDGPDGKLLRLLGRPKCLPPIPVT